MGGMGEVYRARDCKLKREVALKVLPNLFANDEQRMLRFEREAEVLASLNHPNIAHIHGLEDETGVLALVMELVGGETLAERIARGPIALEEAVVLGKQIAEGLECAHDRGIIHRDLKPANVKVTPEGQVKILDFGLAKALQGHDSGADISTSPTISVMATNAGVLLGTAGYMSPEQAKGKSVDRRTDIWAFGCVFYEMLTGKVAFDGETITDRLAGVVRAEPQWTELPENIPGSLRQLLHRCLVKDPKQRLQAIGEARIALEKWLAHPDEEEGRLEVGATMPDWRSKREWIFAALAAAGIVAAIVFAVMYWSRPLETQRTVRSYLKAMPGSSFVLSGPGGFALSPDGQRLAYVAQNAAGRAVLWVRSMDSLQAQPLGGTDGAAFPFWSPDSRSIGFFSDAKVKRVETSGSPPLALCDAANGRGGTWSQDGIILFAPTTNGPIYRVSAAGGTATQVTNLDPSKGEFTHRWPHFLPDGRHFLYLAGSPFGLIEEAKNSIMVGSVDPKESKFLMHTHGGAMYASRHILFLRESTLMAQPFDPKRLELTGDAFPIADPVQEDASILHSVFSPSQNGLLTYLEGSGSSDRELFVADRTGKKVLEVPGGPDAYLAPRVSPDGKRVAYTLAHPGYDVWTYDVARQVKTRLTFGAGNSQANISPVWSPDGKRIAYASIRGGKYALYEKSTDGSGNEELLLEGTLQATYPNDWSPDGKFLAYQQSEPGTIAIWILPLSGERKPYPFLQTQFILQRATFSPDGKWLAYCSTESGENKVYVVPFPGPGGKWQVSPGSGCVPHWRHDGREIFYLTSDNKMMATEVTANGSSFEIGADHALFETRPNRMFGAYDITGDGQRFFVAYEPLQQNTAITLVLNWDAELKKK